MLNKKAPVYIVVILTLAGSAGTYLATSAYNKKRAEQSALSESVPQCDHKVIRLQGYELISPLLFTEISQPSTSLSHINSQLEKMIVSYKATGVINDASVYLRRLGKGEWTSVGAGKFPAGSLMKVPELITFMKMNERNPGLLENRIHYKVPLTQAKNANFVSESIVPGNMYTIRELLYYMIAHSDNNATMVLNQMMDPAVFVKVFTDLGISAPDMNGLNIPITAPEFSLFMRAIYNASYLNIKDSEFCADLLSKSVFNLGLTKDLPKGIKVAHKFGESGDQFTAYFSESAIVYSSGSPYLLTVMTSGKNMKALPDVISQISSRVFSLVSVL